MKKVWIIVIALALFVFPVFAEEYTDEEIAYQDGYVDGHSDGYWEGYNDAKDEWYLDGYNDGMKDAPEVATITKYTEASQAQIDNAVKYGFELGRRNFWMWIGILSSVIVILIICVAVKK